MNKVRGKFYVILAAVIMLSACTGGNKPVATSPAKPAATKPATQAITPTATPIAQTEQEANIVYTLETDTGEHGLVFIGRGGEIDGEINPTLKANPGDVVEITLVNKDGVLHDLTIDEFSVSTGQFDQKDQQKSIRFTVPEAGEYVYYCAIPGHRQAGMYGTLQVGEAAAVAPQATTGQDIVHHPSDIPDPVGDREPQTIQVELEALEVVGQLADNTTYSYFTFNGKVPGPMLRVRVGDTVELKLTNAADNHFPHSIDLHAVTGTGGGHVYTETKPGAESVFTFKALAEGIYVYHCATPSVPHHITNGMYGLILVEPEGGLAPVDHEYYVMQGELYTEQDYGSIGHLDFSADKLSHETPEYYIFNGADGALTKNGNQLTAKVGETIRIFFGVGGPNKTSSFHIIGEIFDRVYTFGALSSAPLTHVQTVTVPPGGAVMVEFTVEVPGQYILVDHALSRTERGAVGYLIVEGPEQPDIFRQGGANP